MALHSYLNFALQAKCHPYFKLIERARIAARDSNGGGAGPWKVPDLCNAYNWPTNLAGGGTIAIVELGGGWIESDMVTFFASIGQPMPQITDVSVDGTSHNQPNHASIDNPKKPNPDVEVALDIQVAAAAYFVATGQAANIRMYWASNGSNGSIAAAIRAATADGCDVCSISWGSDEANWIQEGQQDGTDYLADLEAAAQAATNAGMIVFAASGDNDSSDGGPNPANVDAPSSCPHVIGCGGTAKTLTTEVVWNDSPDQSDGHGTGGGFSTYFPLQSFQAGAPNGPGRMVPDVAGDADPETGYWMVVHGQTIGMGGTSAVAPLYAGLFAALGTKLGFVTPKLWLNHLCFNDITAGDNGFFRARIGPDACTGLGSPIGIKLAQLFAQPIAAQVRQLAQPTVPAGWNGTLICNYANGVLVNTSKLRPE